MSSPVKPSNQPLTCCTDTPETMSPKSTSSSPESRISDEFLEFEGTATFSPTPSPTYRYSMSLKSGELRIWLEDCESKKQWCSTKLSLEDYVDSTNAIPNATATDYVEYFHELLGGGHDDVDDIPITFQRHKGESFRLEMMVKIQVLKQSRVAKYVIDMEPISLERIDVLESKMRDLQDGLSKLRKESEVAVVKQGIELQDLKFAMKLQQENIGEREDEIWGLKKELKQLQPLQDTTTIRQRQATTKQGEWIMWGAASHLQLSTPGMYQALIVVNYQTTGANAAIQLVKGDTVVQSVYCGFNQGYCSSSTLQCITRVETDDQFAVKCPANLTGTSYLTLVRISK